MITGEWFQEFPEAVLGNSKSIRSIAPVVGRTLVVLSGKDPSSEVLPCRVGRVVRLVSVELSGENENIRSL